MLNMWKGIPPIGLQSCPKGKEEKPAAANAEAEGGRRKAGGGGGASQGRAPAGRQRAAEGIRGLRPSQQGQGNTEAARQQGRH